MASTSKAHYHLHNHPDHSHLRWSRSIPPVLTVPSGAEITLELPDGGGNQSMVSSPFMSLSGLASKNLSIIICGLDYFAFFVPPIYAAF